MRQALTRISRVRMKNGGADVVVLEGDGEFFDRKNRAAMKRTVEGMLDRNQCVAGFAFVSWNNEGETFWGYYADGRGTVSPQSMPSFVRDTLFRAASNSMRHVPWDDSAS